MYVCNNSESGVCTYTHTFVPRENKILVVTAFHCTTSDKFVIFLMKFTTNIGGTAIRNNTKQCYVLYVVVKCSNFII